MLATAARLDAGALAAVAALEGRVVAADGGRLKLEWGVLRNRDGRDVNDLLWWDGDSCVGFCGIYDFGDEPEIAGMVDPAARRRGIGTALLQAAAGMLAGRGSKTALLVTPRATPSGSAFAAAMGGGLSHSEHYLVLGRMPDPSGRHPDLVIRDAVGDDVPAMRVILAAAFEEDEDDDEMLLRLMRAPETRQLVVERDGVAVGCLRLGGDRTATGVYGFAVSPELQGQGIGRAVLERVCADLRSAGVRDVTIEVEVDNESALGLYTSVGFEPRATEDYFRVDLAPVVA